MKMLKTMLLAAAATTLPAIAMAQVPGLGDRFVIEYKKGSRDAVAAAVIAAGGEIMRDLGEFDALAVRFESVTGAAELLNLSEIANVEFDPVRQMGPVDVQVSTNDPGAFLLYGLDLVQSEAIDAQPGTGVKICVIDGGYDITHPDLPVANVTGEPDRGSGEAFGLPLINHGTHVAGTIGAIGDNGIGVVGVIPDIETTIPMHIVRTFDANGSFRYASDLVGAIQDCADAGATVVNMSLGGALRSKIEERALEKIRKDGVLLIAAAGNSGIAAHSYPASYDSVMSVAAIDSNSVPAGFTQRASQVEIAGPGVSVVSTVPGGGYGFLSGTSMAAPHVAGVAAKVWSNFPQCSGFDIRNALTASALDIHEEGRDYTTGFGLVQARGAYDYLMENGCSGRVCTGRNCRAD